MQNELSEQECKVVNLIAEGDSNKEIGYKLHLAEGTIKEYLSRIFRKLGFSNRMQVAKWVWEVRYKREGVNDAQSSQFNCSL